mmetsp:Transcript_24903/g.41009  ORF Transcript_24903/g.41009 Transcript_24903/m.41009 type:complete len:202 (-) Transcript_24903:252-857(-)
MLISRYQLGTLFLRLCNLAKARGPMVKGAMPGGQLRHFCDPLYAMSTPQSSMNTGTPDKLVTQSSSSNAPYFRQRSPTPSIGWQEPVEVSACTRARTVGRCCFNPASSSSRENTVPHGLVIRRTSAPYRDAISQRRKPKYPLQPINMTSPGSMMLATLASIAALPVPDTGRVKGLDVCHAYLNISFTSSIICKKKGSKCPT